MQIHACDMHFTDSLHYHAMTIHLLLKGEVYEKPGLLKELLAIINREQDLQEERDPDCLPR